MKKTTIFKLFISLMLITMSIMLLGCKAQKDNTAEGSKKSITVVVTHGDGKAAEFNYSTTAETLSDVLLENKLVEGDNGDYGLFITKVDNEEADSSKEQWWCITKNGGETVNTGADSTEIKDGETYELTLTTGY